VTARRPPTVRNKSDMVGGILHLLAEIVALVGLLAVVAFLAWLMLLP
jgi:hypothetical protein